MPVLTQKEYKQKSSAKKEVKTRRKGGLRKLPERPPDPPDKILYVLLHPEIPEGGSVDFRDVAEINGKKYTWVCENSVVKTTEKVLADFLRAMQYELIEEIKQMAKSEKNEEKKAEPKAKNEPVKKPEPVKKAEPKAAPKPVAKPEENKPLASVHKFKYMDIKVRDFKSTLEINGRMFELVCKGGIIETTEDELAEFLMNQPMYNMQ